MKIFKFTDYNHYKKEQVKANVKKIVNIWINENTVKKITQYIDKADNILCHGVRNAKELEFFKKYYSSADIIGTEISHTAKQFKNVIEWDFHNVKEEWKSKFDIVYSNSWDHSYDHIKSLTTWKDQMSTNGFMFLEHGYDPKDNKSRVSDPLEIYHEEILDTLKQVNLKYITEFTTTALQNKTPARVYVIKK